MVSVIARISSSSPKPHVPAIPHTGVTSPGHASSGPREGGVEVVDHPRGDVELLAEETLACSPPRVRWLGEYLLDCGQGQVVLILCEMPDEPVAPLLVVGVAPSRGRDEDRGHAKHRSLRRHRGRLSHHEPGMGDQVVNLIHATTDSKISEVRREWRLGRHEYPSAALKHLDQVALLLG